MLNMSWSRLVAALICCCTIWSRGSSEALQHLDGGNMGSGMGNSIAGPGQPLYYLMADVGSTVGPNDELKRTNRHLLKWWEDLFGQNNCCNNNNNNLLNNYNNNNNLLPNNCNGLQLQNLDPFKQMKLFKKLPDLWGNNNCGGQCGGQCGGLQPVNNYAAPVAPSYGSGDSYAPPSQPAPAVPAAPVDYSPAPAPPSGGYETPNPAYDGPGDGDASYVAPAAPPPPPPPAAESYEAPPPADDYAAPPAANYDAPAPAPPSYEPAAPAPAAESYNKGDDYGKPDKGYGGAQPPQIVYQPIIYLTTGSKGEMDYRPKPQEQSYEAPREQPQPQPAYEPPPAPAPAPAPVYAPPPAPAAAPALAPPCNTPACAGYLPLLGVPFYSYPAPPAPQPAPVYAAPPPPPAPVYAPAPAAPPAPSYASPACQTPIRLSLYDQPYRVAPELFQEYNYRLSLADHNNSL